MNVLLNMAKHVHNVVRRVKMLPIIMAALSMAKQKAQNENNELNQLAQNGQGAIQMAPQMQMPTINSVFGQR